jgi:FkbM family methyltransferase
MSYRDNRFIFNILRKQILNRVNWADPSNNSLENAANMFWDSVCENGMMHINRAKMPDIRWYSGQGWYSWPTVYADSMMIHHLFEDNYSEENCDLIESMGTDGPYCYEKVRVEKRDAVIDAGAFIGDWSSVAAAMGGNVYAFEPSPASIPLLTRCAELNDFKVITMGLGDRTCNKMIDTTKTPIAETVNEDKGVPCKMITLDEFADKNKIHIDFIKADIEGYERYLLEGASKVLKEDHPKLALRTYHNNGDDSYVLPKIIHTLNPDYKIINRRKILYAYVE